MDSIQEAMEKVIFEDEGFSTPIPYSIMYMPWEANEVCVYWGQIQWIHVNKTHDFLAHSR